MTATCEHCRLPTGVSQKDIAGTFTGWCPHCQAVTTQFIRGITLDFEEQILRQHFKKHHAKEPGPGAEETETTDGGIKPGQD